MRIASIAASLVLLGFVTSGGASAADVKKIDCEMKFSMSGWSAFYKTASGTGMITCDNGQSLAVKLNAKGGGLTFGKSSIEDGHGEFSEVHSLDELLGAYASAEAHAGAVKSTQAEAMTKGEVSLALTGKGRGWDLGIAFGKLVISR